MSGQVNEDMLLGYVRQYERMEDGSTRFFEGYDRGEGISALR